MKIYNTMTRQKEEFVPITPGKVGIYACGPTVYNFFHIGNARPFIVFDVLRRYMKHLGYEVIFVQNFTDIDDKLIRKANEEGTTVAEIAEKYIKEYFVDAEGLGVEKADVHPRATKHIGEIIAMIKKLEDKGYAYRVDNGDVYFDTQAFSGYGRLSGQNLEDREAGARIDVDEVKKNYMDFALWKAQKPGEPAWKSPWGMGRPGWHIECSVMSKKYLGEEIDIHGGGEDLIFPHHENEIAQSECCSGKIFSNYWMHNGFLNINGLKMSKSLGNFFTVRDITAQYDPMVLRLFILSAQYRQPLNFSREVMEQAKASYERILNCTDKLKALKETAKGSEMTEEEKKNTELVKGFIQSFEEAMEDDNNTANASTAVYEIVRIANATTDENSTKAYVDYVYDVIRTLCDGVLGVISERKTEDLDAEVEALIAERTAARKEKNWAKADEIRDRLGAMGIILEDTKEGVKWKKA